MNVDEICEELNDFPSECYFVNMLESFIWDRVSLKVVPYYTKNNPHNDLVVYDTIPVKLNDKTLLKYLEEQEVRDIDVLVFCVNEEYYPNQTDNWVRLKILRNIHKKKEQNSRRKDPNKISKKE